jgi:hypothetical protein
MMGKMMEKSQPSPGTRIERPRCCNTGAGRARQVAEEKKARLETPMLTKGRATTRADATHSKNKTTRTRRLETGTRRRTRQRATESMASQKSTQRETSPPTQGWTDRFPMSQIPLATLPRLPRGQKKDTLCGFGLRRVRYARVHEGAGLENSVRCLKGLCSPASRKSLDLRRFTKDPAQFFVLYILIFPFTFKNLARRFSSTPVRLWCSSPRPGI